MPAPTVRLLIALLMIAAGAYTIFIDRAALQGLQLPALGRAAVAALGFAAAAALLSGPKLAGGVGWALALAWAVVQIPIFVTSIEGAPNITAASIPLALTSSQSVNGQLTHYSQIGVNIFALGLAGWLLGRRARLAAPA